MLLQGLQLVVQMTSFSNKVGGLEKKKIFFGRHILLHVFTLLIILFFSDNVYEYPIRFQHAISW